MSQHPHVCTTCFNIRSMTALHGSGRCREYNLYISRLSHMANNRDIFFFFFLNSNWRNYNTRSIIVNMSRLPNNKGFATQVDSPINPLCILQHKQSNWWIICLLESEEIILVLVLHSLQVVKPAFYRKTLLTWPFRWDINIRKKLVSWEEEFGDGLISLVLQIRKYLKTGMWN